jgi:hypothetical protein
MYFRLTSYFSRAGAPTSAQAFHPSDDELTRRLSTVELVVDGENLNDLQMSVSESFLDSAKVQARLKQKA